MSDLKPCPIPSCGGMGSYEETEDGDHYVECVDCGYCGKSFMSFDAAVDWWNTRPIEDALRAEATVERNRRQTFERHLAEREAEVAALKAELAAAKTAEGEAMLVVESQDISIEKLKVKLKEYAEPLTDEQARAVLMVERKRTSHSAEDIVMEWDDAIREVRSK